MILGECVGICSESGRIFEVIDSKRDRVYEIEEYKIRAKVGKFIASRVLGETMIGLNEGNRVIYLFVVMVMLGIEVNI